MKKLMIAVAGAVALGCSAFATTTRTWFDGGVKEGWPTTAEGGAWANTSPSYYDADLGRVVVDAEDASPLTFSATSAKTIGETTDTTTQIVVNASMVFTPFDAVPAALPTAGEASAQIGLIIVKNGEVYNPYVISAGTWTKCDATVDPSDPIAVKVAISTAGVSYYAGVTLLNATPIAITQTAFQHAKFTGDGELANLDATWDDPNVALTLPAPAANTTVVVSNLTKNVAVDGVNNVYSFMAGEDAQIWVFAKNGYLFSNGENFLKLDVKMNDNVDYSEVVPEEPTEAAAKIGTKLYLTLDAAIKGALANETVTLVKNVAESIVYSEAKAFTLDLGGKTWAVAGDATALKVDNADADVTITNGAITVAQGFCVWARQGNVTIKNGTFTNNDNDNYAIYAGGGVAPNYLASKVTIEGGSFVNLNGSPYVWGEKLHNLNLNVQNGNDQAVIEVSGGTFTAEPRDDAGKNFVVDGKWAVKQGGVYIITDEEPAAAIGTTLYFTLNDALYDVREEASAEIVVRKDHTTHGTAASVSAGPSCSNLVINLNNKTVLVDAADGYKSQLRFFQGTTVTIKDGTIGRDGAGTDPIRTYATKMILENVTIDATEISGQAIIWTNGDLELKGTTAFVNVSNGVNAVDCGNYAGNAYAMGTLTFDTTGTLEGNWLFSGGTVEVKQTPVFAATAKFYYGAKHYTACSDADVAALGFAARIGGEAVPTGSDDEVTKGEYFLDLGKAATAVATTTFDKKLTLLAAADTEDVASIAAEDCTLDLNGQSFTVADGKSFTITGDLAITNGAAGGGLVVAGTVNANGYVNLYDLAYGAGGLVAHQGGQIAIGAAGTVKFMSVWSGISPNLLMAQTPGFMTAVDGAKVDTGKVYTYSGDAFVSEDCVAKTTVSCKIVGTEITTDYIETFDSLEAAIAAAKDDGTVTLLKDIALTQTLTLSKAITLDLGNKVVTLPAAGDGFKLTAAATVQNGTLQSQLAENKVAYALHSYKTSAVYSNLVVNAANYRFAVYAEGADTVEACYGENDPTTTVSCYNVDVKGNGTLFEAEFTLVNLDANCSAIAEGTAWNYAAAIYSAGNATVTIAGGTYSHEKALLSGNLGGKIVVNGGEFTGSVYSWMDSTAHPTYNDDPKYKAYFTLNAGTFSGTVEFFKDDDASRALEVITKGADVALAVPAGYGWDYKTTLAKMLKYYVSVYANGQYFTWAGLGTNDAYYAKGEKVMAEKCGITNLNDKTYFVTNIALVSGSYCSFKYDGTKLTKVAGDLDVAIAEDGVTLSYEVTTGESYELDPLGHARFGRIDFVEYSAAVEPVTPGEPTEPFDNPEAATNAAEYVNTHKDTAIAVPTGVEGDAKATYLTKVEAKVTSDNRVVVDMTAAAKVDEQAAVDEAVTDTVNVVPALTSSDASVKATLTSPTPGFYYWIDGGTAPDAVTTPGAGVFSTDGSSIELSKPTTLDTSVGKAFYKIAVGVSAPVPPDAE